MTRPRRRLAPAVQRPWQQQVQHTLSAMLMGALGALGFPFRLPFWGQGPLLDWAPRELFLLVFGAWIYVQLTGPLPLRRQFLRIGWAAFAFYAVLISWLDIAMERFGGMTAWQAWPAVVALFALCAALSALVVPLFGLLRGAECCCGPVAFATAWTVAEWARGVATQFPWGQWGYAAARVLPLCQWAAYGGFYLVTFWIALLSAGLGAFVCQPEARRAGLVVRWAVGCGLVLSVGAVRLLRPNWVIEASWPTVRVGVVQPNISQEVKNQARAHRTTILQTLRRLSLQAARQGAQIVVWPEGAWPGYLPADVSRLPAEPFGLPLLTGAGLIHAVQAHGADPAPPPAIYNSALMTDANLWIAGRYDKQKLVPFGEYVPFRGLLPINKLVPGTIDCSAGSGGKPLSQRAFGVLICYDGVYPGPARAHVLGGAQALVNLTNDAWYGLSSAPYQHRDYYVLRAIESGRYIVRAANSGISLGIDALGRMTPGTALNAATIQTLDVVLAPSAVQTVYVRFGDVWLYMCLAAVCLALLRAAHKLR